VPDTDGDDESDAQLALPEALTEAVACSDPLSAPEPLEATDADAIVCDPLPVREPAGDTDPETLPESELTSEADGFDADGALVFDGAPEPDARTETDVVAQAEKDAREGDARADAETVTVDAQSAAEATISLHMVGPLELMHHADGSGVGVTAKGKAG